MRSFSQSRGTAGLWALAVGLLMLLVLFPARPASATTVVLANSGQTAESDEQPLESKTATVTVELAKSGLVQVSEVHTWVVPGTAAPRIVRALPLFTAYSEEHLKRFEYSNFAVSSPDSEFTMRVLDNGANLEVQLNPVIPPSDNPAQPTVTEAPEFTTLTAVLSYQVQGTLTSVPTPDSLVATTDSQLVDEFFWSPIENSKLNLDSLEVIIQAPTMALAKTCEIALTGLVEPETETAQCTEPTDNVPSAPGQRFLAQGLTSGSSLTVEAMFPNKTFEVTQSLNMAWQEPGEEGTNDEVVEPFDPTWTENLDQGKAVDQGNLLPFLMLGALVVAVGLGFLLTRKRSDYRFSQTAPGEIPELYETHSIERATTPVRGPRSTTPPQDLSPAEAGALTHAGLRAREVMSTLVDLAQRGALTITEHGTNDGKSVWRFTHSVTAQSPDWLNPVERSLLEAVFDHGPQTEIESMHASFAPASLEVLRTLGQEMANKALFRQFLEHESTNHGHRKQRTGLGRALYEQLDGFGQFLAAPTPGELTELTVQNSLTEVFSKYLPYALSFACEREWATACDDFAQKVGQPTWFSSDVSPWDGTYQKLVNRLMILVQTGH